jgi:hypothetical protein
MATTRETADRVLARLRELKDEDDDWESSHIEADGLLCEMLTALGYEDIVKAFNDLGKWYA